MSSLFHRPNVPAPQAPVAAPAPPTVDQATVDQQNNDAVLLRRRRGRAAMMLGGANGYGPANTATRTLLGQ